MFFDNHFCVLVQQQMGPRTCLRPAFVLKFISVRRLPVVVVEVMLPETNPSISQ